jgi:3-dehydroquinate synthase
MEAHESSPQSTTQGFRVCDEIPLPRCAAPVRASAARDDAYAIHVTRSMDATVKLLADLTSGARLAIITDDRVYELHGGSLQRALEAAGIGHEFYRLPPGEPSKSTASAVKLWDWLAASDIGRRDFIVTFGGGVINDLGGWVASAFMRGVPYVNLPTTLLAQVDGAMGGKVAANHPTAKNLIGAFYQPVGVISNVAFLSTLDARNLAAGLAESIKKALIASPEYWTFINDAAPRIMAKDATALELLVHGAAAIKSRLVERDPYERDLRRPLNFGHTVGHPLETVAGYGTLLHGEAVAFGMMAETQLAANRGMLREPLDTCLRALLVQLGLPHCWADLPQGVHADALIAATEPVARIRAGSRRFVLLERVGVSVIVEDIADDELYRSLTQLGYR